MTAQSSQHPVGGMTDRSFGADVVPRATGPTLDPSELANGAVVKHIGSEKKEFTVAGEKRRSFLHTFQLPVVHGAHVFGVWGSVELDRKLRELKPGAVALVRYEGRGEPATPGQHGPHKWTVRPFLGSPVELKNIVQQEWTTRHEMIVTAIAAATERQKQDRDNARAGSAPDAAPPDDSDGSVF